MTIADPSRVVARAFVDEGDIAELEVGQTTELVATAYPDRPLAGKIKFVANSARNVDGRRGRFVQVRIQITDRPDVHLLPGMSCRVAIFVGSKEELLSVPVNAMVVKEDVGSMKVEHSVFTVEDGRARLTHVVAGTSDDEHQAVLVGLNLNSQVIIGPAATLRYLRDGDRVALRSEG